jgi:signal transduction histidine kinase
MWQKISLRGRIYIILGLMVAITAAGGAGMVAYTYRMETQMAGIFSKDLAGYRAAEALETALANQKGFASYYLLDGDPGWLRQLAVYRQVFMERFNDARKLADGAEQNEALDKIDGEYRLYVRLKDRVIDHYKAGERVLGARLHQEVRTHFFKILELCDKYKAIHIRQAEIARQESHRQVIKSRLIAVAVILVDFFLSLALAIFMVRQILGPVRRLARETDPAWEFRRSEDDVKALSRSVHGLMEDIDQTHVELEKSREHLLQSEKMVMVGKLAAGMAHSIRNPFTSVKMRLFSMSRSLKMTAEQQEDFEVISEEIRHIDTIVENFLEFSRPPKLQTKPISPSHVVDLTIQLLGHRLESYDVAVAVVRERPLPEIEGDPDQLKEVFMNLIVNACQAIGSGGAIEIREDLEEREDIGTVAVLRIWDDGPGIPAAIQEKIFQPFYTTKEEGTGLGLSIASRIIEEHWGKIEVKSREGEGTTFVITLPVKE